MPDELCKQVLCYQVILTLAKAGLKEAKRAQAGEIKYSEAATDNTVKALDGCSKVLMEEIPNYEIVT